MANLSSTRIFGDGTVERSLYVKQRLGVGIGNPNHGLHVFSDENQPAEIESPSGSTWLDLTSNSGRKWSVGSSGSGKFQVYDRSQNEYFISLQSNGYLGLGRNVRNPDTNLDIQSDSGYTSIRMKAGSDSGMSIGVDSNDGDKFKLGDSWNPTFGTHLTVDQGGNVGIGTTSPDQKLDVEGAADLNGRLNMRGNNITNVNIIRVNNGSVIGISGGGNPEIEFEGNGIEIQGNESVSFGDQQGKDGLDMQGREIHFADQASIGLDGNGVNVEIQDGSGSRGQLELFDVYVGESNTWVDDHIGNDDAHHPDHRDAVEYIDFSNNERSDYDGQDGKLYWDLSEGLYISSSNSKTGSTSVLQWSRSNVNPGSNISISYDNRGRPTISASGGNTYTDNDARDAILNSSLGLGEGFRFHDDTSNLNTGTLTGNDYRVLRIEDSNSPNSPDGAFVLTSGDDDEIIQEWFDVGTEIHTDLYVRQDVIAYYSSDRRLKDNATQIQNPMSKIENFTGVGFDWKEEASRDGSGFGIFAQDAKKVDERLVRKQGDGYLGVDYQQLHGIEIEALKQVNEKVEENQSEIQRLKQRIAKLESNDNAI